MKSKIWRTDGQERWDWDKNGKIQVFGLSGVFNDEIVKEIEIITELINEFALSLSVSKGDINIKDKLEQLVQQCSDKDEINFDYMEEELNRLRRETKFLTCGVIIIVNNTYSFKESDHESAVYASASYEGLMIIKREYISLATKHEFGHMIGLGKHHKNCVMDYLCIHDKFCEKCRKDIIEMWEL